VTPKGRKNYAYAPTREEMAAKAFAKVNDFWRGLACYYLKRALAAEARLAQYEGPIG
jgi:hypothetical protein